MSKLTEMRDKALEAGVNALVPVISKVAGKAQDLAEGPVGKAVGSAVDVGAHVVSKAPGIGRLVGGNSSPSTNGTQEAAPSEAASGGPASGGSASGTDTAPTRSPRKNPKSSKAPAKKTTVRKVGQTEASPAAPSDNASEVGSRSPGGVTPTDARDLPITGYTKLRVTDIQKRLDGLTQTQLASVYRFEKANQGRSGVLKALDKRMVQLPLPLYDSLTLPAILDDLNGLTKPELKVIRDYEARTANRLPILERADELLAVPLPGE